MTSDEWELDSAEALKREKVWIWLIVGSDDHWIVNEVTPSPRIVANHRCYATQRDAFLGLLSKFERKKINIEGQITALRTSGVLNL
jgi:hypothetical protein